MLVFSTGFSSNYWVEKEELAGKWQIATCCVLIIFRPVHVPYVHHYNPHFVYFYSIFHCSLYYRAVSVTDNSCSKPGNSSIGSKVKSSVYKWERFQIKSGLWWPAYGIWLWFLRNSVWTPLAAFKCNNTQNQPVWRNVPLDKIL